MINNLIKNVKNIKNDFIHGESFPDGVMFNDDSFLSVSYKEKNGEIKNNIVKIRSVIKNHPIFNYIIIIKGLIYFFEGSINQYIARNQIYNSSIKKDTFNKSLSVLNVIVIILIGFILYFLIPTLISFYLKRYELNYNILYGIEILSRLTLFFLILLVINITPNAKKTAYFHGAEHKTILCYLKGEKINLENVKKYPIFNPMCGTSFIFILLIISIPVFYFLNYENLFFRIIIMLIILPILIGLSFEILGWYGKSKLKKGKIRNPKFVIFQRLNTKEPNDEHLKISINALTNLLNLYKTKN